jgi:hypothetical protein
LVDFSGLQGLARPRRRSRARPVGWAKAGSAASSEHEIKTMRPRKYSEMPGVRTETMLASMARDQTETALSTLVGIMTSATAKDADRIAAIKILIDRGWGKAVEQYAVEGQNGQRLMKIVHEFVRLDPQPKVELEGEALQIEWKDVKSKCPSENILNPLSHL